MCTSICLYSLAPWDLDGKVPPPNRYPTLENDSYNDGSMSLSINYFCVRLFVLILLNSPLGYTYLHVYIITIRWRDIGSVHQEHWWPFSRENAIEQLSTMLLELNREYFEWLECSQYYNHLLKWRGLLNYVFEIILCHSLIHNARMHAHTLTHTCKHTHTHANTSILDILDRRVSFQLQYQLIFSVWMLSFKVDIVERMKE